MPIIIQIIRNRQKIIVLDNHDLCKLFGVTKRTIARYRQKKLLPYYTYDNGRVYYKSSEVEKFMKKKGHLPDNNQAIIVIIP